MEKLIRSGRIIVFLLVILCISFVVACSRKNSTPTSSNVTSVFNGTNEKNKDNQVDIIEEDMLIGDSIDGDSINEDSINEDSISEDSINENPINDNSTSDNLSEDSSTDGIIEEAAFFKGTKFPGLYEMSIYIPGAFVSELRVLNNKILILYATGKAWGKSKLQGLVYDMYTSTYTRVSFFDMPSFFYYDIEIEDGWLILGDSMSNVYAYDEKLVLDVVKSEQLAKEGFFSPIAAESNNAINGQTIIPSWLETDSSSELLSVEIDYVNNCALTYTFLLGLGDQRLIELRCYDLATGGLRNSCVVDNKKAGYTSTAYLDRANHKYMTTFTSDGCVYVYAWDYQTETNNMDEFYSRPSDSYIYLNEKRAYLEQQYDINIYVGKECPVTELGYRCEQVGDEKTLLEALETLENILGECPQDLFHQFKRNGKRVFSIYLCGKIEATGSLANVNNPLGFSSRYGLDEFIVIDITQDKAKLPGAFFHELAHCMDRDIEAYYEDAELDYDGLWNQLNPEGFRYTHDYKIRNEDPGMLVGKARPSDVYFIDGYSTTFEVEDRARIFENIMMFGRDETPILEADMEPLILKATVLLMNIRMTYDTEGWPEQTVWEKNFEKLLAN